MDAKRLLLGTEDANAERIVDIDPRNLAIAILCAHGDGLAANSHGEVVKEEPVKELVTLKALMLRELLFHFAPRLRMIHLSLRRNLCILALYLNEIIAVRGFHVIW